MIALLNSLVLVMIILDVAAAAVAIGPRCQYSLLSPMTVPTIPLSWLRYYHYHLDCVRASVIGP